MIVPEAHAAPFEFSDAEYGRRRSALHELMAAAELDHVLLRGENRSGSAVPWLTAWPVTREAWVLVSVEEPDVILINHYNHVPNARRLCLDAQVRWAGPDPLESVLALLDERGATAVGTIGPIAVRHHSGLSAGRAVVDLDADFQWLRMVKSDEEIAALRNAAALTDLAAQSLLDACTAGVTEYELTATLEYAYVSHGGGHHIHYLAVTRMDAPDRCVPAQWPTARAVTTGDVVTFELSASSAPDYPGQLLRTFTVGADPTPLISDLHEVAMAVFDAMEAILRPGVTAAQLLETARIVDDAGFTVVDDLVHGFGGGYLPPVIGSPRRAPRAPDVTLEAGMTVVVQPNIATADTRLGVQTGELLLITHSGPQRLHTFPRGLGRVG